MLKVAMLTQQRKEVHQQYARYLSIIWFSRILHIKSTSVTGCSDVKKGLIKPVWMRAIF